MDATHTTRWAGVVETIAFAAMIVLVARACYASDAPTDQRVRVVHAVCQRDPDPAGCTRWVLSGGGR